MTAVLDRLRARALALMTSAAAVMVGLQFVAPKIMDIVLDLGLIGLVAVAAWLAEDRSQAGR